MSDKPLRAAVEIVARELNPGAWWEAPGDAVSKQEWLDQAGEIIAAVTPVIVAAAREAAADEIASLCHWTQRRGNARDESHWHFHYGSPCPYEAMAAVLCGEPDPRGHADAGPQTGHPDPLLPGPGGRCPAVLHCHEATGHEGPHLAVSLGDSVHEWREVSGLGPDAMDWTPAPHGSASDVWRSSGGRGIGRTPDKVTRHCCGCVTGWDDAFEECVLTRCQGHSVSLLQPREQPPSVEPASGFGGQREQARCRP